MYEHQKGAFLVFACGLVTDFGISQKGIQEILRNTPGTRLSEIISVNIIPPKDEIVSTLKSRKDLVAKKVGLKFSEIGPVIVGYTNVKQHIEFLLSQPGLDGVVDLPNKTLLIFTYADLAPFLKWSRHFSGITNLRLKIVEPLNRLSLIVTLAVYLGPDDYDTLRSCFTPVYHQLAELNSVKISGNDVKVLYRCGGDGKQRRVETGNSSAKSTYPICEAPEHTNQLGNMKVVCKQPVWSVADAKQLATDYSDWLKDKPDNRTNRRLYAKENLGNTGRENINGNDLQYNYPGTFHFTVRAVESICLRIAQCAQGKYEYVNKLYNRNTKPYVQ